MFGLQLNITEYLPSIDHLRGCELSYLGLSALPNECLTQLKSVQKLILSNNHFSGIPQPILQLRDLQFLDLSANRFTVLPDSISFCKNLRCLST